MITDLEADDIAAHLVAAKLRNDRIGFIVTTLLTAQNSIQAAYVTHSLADVIRCHAKEGAGVITPPGFGLDVDSLAEATKYASAVANGCILTQRAILEDWAARKRSPVWEYHMAATVIYILASIAAAAIEIEEGSDE